MIERQAARVILVDDRDRVLLFRGQDPGPSDAGPFWFTPGGGLEDGEHVEDAARREVREETGFAIDHLGAVVFERHTEFDFDGGHYAQAEQFFIVRVAPFDVSEDGWTDVERRFMSDHRWWTLDELGTTSDIIHPVELAALVAAFLDGGA